MITAGFQGMLRYWWDDLNEASKTFILQGGILKNFENVITLFFAAMVIQFLGSQQKIKDRAEYKQYYVNYFPSSFSNLVKERIKSARLQIDDQITLAQINAFIDEVADLECVRLRMKKEFKQVKGFNSSFCNKETKSKDFGCATAEKKCSCKVKNRRNKYDKKYKVARRARKLSKEERKKVRCYICQKEGHIAPECPKHKKCFGNAVLPEKYEYEVVYCNRFEKHDIPISEYMQYESEEDETSDSTSSESPTEAVSTFSDDTSSVMFNMYESEEDKTSDSTSFESPTEAVSTFSDDTSSVMFNMVRKPYAFPKKAKALRGVIIIRGLHRPQLQAVDFLLLRGDLAFLLRGDLPSCYSPSSPLFSRRFGTSSVPDIGRLESGAKSTFQVATIPHGTNLMKQDLQPLGCRSTLP
ncbi:hypothetical protein L7F22_044325 [Adiantum nelumboides]|nr:hypothetical protein [Adiantum nelumboides]